MQLEALALALGKNARLNIRNAYELLANIYEALHQPALAYGYYKQYVQMKEAVLNDQLKGKTV